jgi:transcriptional regulator with XRE-family HTH domain
MRSKVLQEIIDNTPKDVHVFVRLYGDIVMRIHELLQEKGLNQKGLAEKMDKKPSEISKWLSGEHNFTLRSLAKLEAEIGEPIINVPQRRVYTNATGNMFSMTVLKNDIKPDFSGFEEAENSTETSPNLNAA